MIFNDFAPISGTRKTSDGYLVTEARIARANNVQSYLGSEVGRPDLATVRVFRPEAEVFSKDAMASASHKPVTMGHPSEQVDATRWKASAIGWTGDGVARDGDFLKISMMIADADAIRAVEAGTRSLSAGYSCDLDWTGGVTPSGETFDARQTNIRLNHVSCVPQGRCPGAKIGDAQPQGASMLQDAIAFAGSNAGKSAIAYEGYVAYLNRREPKSAAELLRDHQAAYAETAKQIAYNAIALPIARAAADKARADMIAGFNGGRS